MGNHLLKRLGALADKHDIIGDVRGKGLMLGLEMVKDKGTKASHRILTQCSTMVADLFQIFGQGSFRKIWSKDNGHTGHAT